MKEKSISPKNRGQSQDSDNEETNPLGNFMSAKMNNLPVLLSNRQSVVLKKVLQSPLQSNKNLHNHNPTTSSLLGNQQPPFLSHSGAGIPSIFPGVSPNADLVEALTQGNLQSNSPSKTVESKYNHATVSSTVKQHHMTRAKAFENYVKVAGIMENSLPFVDIKLSPKPTNSLKLNQILENSQNLEDRRHSLKLNQQTNHQTTNLSPQQQLMTSNNPQVDANQFIEDMNKRFSENLIDKKKGNAAKQSKQTKKPLDIGGIVTAMTKPPIAPNASTTVQMHKQNLGQNSSPSQLPIDPMKFHRDIKNVTMQGGFNFGPPRNPVLIENTPAARERNFLRNQQRLQQNHHDMLVTLSQGGYLSPLEQLQMSELLQQSPYYRKLYLSNSPHQSQNQYQVADNQQKSIAIKPQSLSPFRERQLYMDSMHEHGLNLDLRHQVSDQAFIEHTSSYEVLNPKVPVIQISSHQSRAKNTSNANSTTQADNSKLPQQSQLTNSTVTSSNEQQVFMHAAPIHNIYFPLEHVTPKNHNDNESMYQYDNNGGPSSIIGDRKRTEQKQTREQQNRIKKILNEGAYLKGEKRGAPVISVMQNTEPQQLPFSFKTGQNSQAILNELNAFNGRVTLTDALGIPVIANISTPQTQIGRGASRNNQSQYSKFAMTEVMKSSFNPTYPLKDQSDGGHAAKNTRNILNSKVKGTVGRNFGVTLTSFGNGSIIQDNISQNYQFQNSNQDNINWQPNDHGSRYDDSDQLGPQDKKHSNLAMTMLSFNPNDGIYNHEETYLEMEDHMTAADYRHHQHMAMARAQMATDEYLQSIGASLPGKDRSSPHNREQFDSSLHVQPTQNSPKGQEEYQKNEEIKKQKGSPNKNIKTINNPNQEVLGEVSENQQEQFYRFYEMMVRNQQILTKQVVNVNKKNHGSFDERKSVLIKNYLAQQIFAKAADEAAALSQTLHQSSLLFDVNGPFNFRNNKSNALQMYSTSNSQFSKKANYLAEFLKQKQIKNKGAAPQQENQFAQNTISSGFQGNNRNSLQAALFDQNAATRFGKKEAHLNFDFMRDHLAQNVQNEKKRSPHQAQKSHQQLPPRPFRDHSEAAQVNLIKKIQPLLIVNKLNQTQQQGFNLNPQMPAEYQVNVMTKKNSRKFKVNQQSTDKESISRLIQHSPSKNGSKMGMTHDATSPLKMSLKKNSLLEAEHSVSNWKAKRLDRFVDAVSGGDYNGWEEAKDIGHAAQNDQYNEDELIDQTDDNMEEDSPQQLKPKVLQSPNDKNSIIGSQIVAKGMSQTQVFQSPTASRV